MSDAEIIEFYAGDNAPDDDDAKVVDGLYRCEICRGDLCWECDGCYECTACTCEGW